MMTLFTMFEKCCMVLELNKKIFFDKCIVQFYKLCYTLQSNLIRKMFHYDRLFLKWQDLQVH